ncbi:MAG: hypothetical protein WAO00_00455 [Chthoniobacterales bacterium]
MRKIASVTFLLSLSLFRLAWSQAPQRPSLLTEELEKYEDPPLFIFRTGSSPGKLSVHGLFASHQVTVMEKK